MTDRQQKINDLKESLKKILEIDGVKDALARLERGAVDDADYIKLLEENCDAWEKACHILRDKLAGQITDLEQYLTRTIKTQAKFAYSDEGALKAIEECIKILKGEA